VARPRIIAGDRPLTRRRRAHCDAVLRRLVLSGLSTGLILQTNTPTKLTPQIWPASQKWRARNNSNVRTQIHHSSVTGERASAHKRARVRRGLPFLLYPIQVPSFDNISICLPRSRGPSFGKNLTRRNRIARRSSLRSTGPASKKDENGSNSVPPPLEPDDGRASRPPIVQNLQHFGRAIRRSELRRIVPLADTTIYETEQRGEFPRRFYLTARCVVWDLAEVEGWIEERRRTSNTSLIKRTPSPNVRLRKARPVRQ
jgi:prophage regulatory protein